MLTTTQHLYKAAGLELKNSRGSCWLCGGSAFDPVARKDFVRPTFTDHDKVACPDSDVICAACVFCCGERSELLASLVGKEKPQRMRTYSHFIVGGRWLPLGKDRKSEMAKLLMQEPQVAIIALSGQKHIIFRAQPGWWQIEEQSAQPFPNELQRLLRIIEKLYTTFSKSEIETGQYLQYRIRKFSMSNWWTLESQIKPDRSSLSFRLALFLAQKKG